MDREASGYIQVAKIATERLLKLLTETELMKRSFDVDQLVCMTHYFGYVHCPLCTLSTSTSQLSSDQDLSSSDCIVPFLSSIS